MPKFDSTLASITPGLIADAVTRQLESPEKTVDQAVMAEAITRFKRMFLKQAMLPRSDRKGYESGTSYTGPCARKARYTYDGADRPSLSARTVLKFMLGDTVELTVLAIAKLAGLDISLNNEDLTIEGLDCKLIPVHPDGLLHANDKYYNVEIKSCDSHTFDRWLANGGPDDTWGYRTQFSIEIEAWRQNMVEVNETVCVAVSTGTRQGSIAEWVLPYEPQLVAEWHNRRSLAQAAALPPIPFEAELEMEFVRGAGIPIGRYGTPRRNEKGTIYGWDCQTGRSLVPLQCTYCDYRKLDYPDAVMEMDGHKPVWVVPAAITTKGEVAS